jgi:hypothetical protein
LNRSLQLLEKYKRIDHGDLHDCLNCLFAIAEAQAKNEEAEVLIRRMLSIEEKHSGSEAAKVGDILRDYARILRKLGRRDEAAQLEKRSFAIRHHNVMKFFISN